MQGGMGVNLGGHLVNCKYVARLGHVLLFGCFNLQAAHGFADHQALRNTFRKQYDFLA